jgi:hypothetical protein
VGLALIAYAAKGFLERQAQAEVLHEAGPIVAL